MTPINLCHDHSWVGTSECPKCAVASKTERGNKMTQHPQADILRAIADGEQIQYQYIESEWRDRDSCFVLARLSNLDVTRPFYKFRIKPATITLNGTELPKPVSPEPEDTWKCYGLRIGDDIFWFNTPEDRDAVYAKLVEVLGS